jgi:hypothetical protein
MLLWPISQSLESLSQTSQSDASDRNEIQDLAEALDPVVTNKSRVLFVAPVLTELPSDEDVCQFVWTYHRKISMTDLIKLMDLLKCPQAAPQTTRCL